jgi:stearoyl-CoA desaturase (Delta-9 desaturase)
LSRNNSQFNWGPGLFIIVYHVIIAVGLPLYLIYAQMASTSLIICSSVLMYITGLGVTMGYHRLYSHKAFKINPVAEAVMLFFATMATQGSAIRWSFDHRHHHSFVDTDRDPYTITKGFWYAHFLWLFEKPKKVEDRVVADLVRKPLLRFQHRYYGTLWFVTNAIAFFSFGFVFQDYLGAFIFTILLRMLCLHHFTWLINSLAHVWGARSFCKELTAVDNYIIALLTFGEGYHNYHHTFAQDYRNGIRWFHFDPTKWLIWSLYKLGLAKQLRTVPDYQIQEKMLLERKNILLADVKDSNLSKDWEAKISETIESVTDKWKRVKKLQESYMALKKEGAKESLRSLKLEIKELKIALEREYRAWSLISQEIQLSKA